MKARRDAYLAGRCCAHCGSTENLELDHIDRTTKHDGPSRQAVSWSWSQERRDTELAKCQVLCRQCHYRKGRAAGDLGTPGNLNGASRLTEEDAATILASTERAEDVAARYGIHVTHVHRIRRGAAWGYLQAA